MKNTLVLNSRLRPQPVFSSDFTLTLAILKTKFAGSVRQIKHDWTVLKKRDKNTTYHKFHVESYSTIMMLKMLIGSLFARFTLLKLLSNLNLITKD